jgi:glycosyltransferase involved in cell wall biosynthesis
MNGMTVADRPDRPVAIINTTSGRPLVLNRIELMQAWLAAGFAVYAVAPDFTAKEKSIIAELGATAIDIPMRRNQLDVAGDIAYAWAFYKLCRRLRPVFVLSYYQKAVIYGSLAAKFAGVRRIVALMAGLGYAFNEGGGAKRRAFALAVGLLNRAAFQVCRPVIFQNHDDVDTLVGLGVVRRSNCVVVDGSGVDIDQYTNTPLPAGAPRFLMLSRLLRSKGVGEFIEAARIVRQRYPDAIFELAGHFEPGSPDEVDPAMIDEAVASGTIRYLKVIPDVRPALAACTAFVLPSYYREGIPRASLEALAAGRAIVTADSPGCRETVIDGVNGFLVPPRDAKAIADALISLIEKRELAEAMGAASRALAESRFDVRLVVRQMLDGIDASGPEPLFAGLRETTAVSIPS